MPSEWHVVELVHSVCLFVMLHFLALSHFALHHEHRPARAFAAVVGAQGQLAAQRTHGVFVEMLRQFHGYRVPVFPYSPHTEAVGFYCGGYGILKLPKFGVVVHRALCLVCRSASSLAEPVFLIACFYQWVKKIALLDFV